jgi:chromosome segregation ATPase
MGELAASVEQVEELRAREAELVGRVRGLEARWAETDELNELTAARHMLTEHDLAAARGQIRELEAELAETRDQLELAMLKARGPSVPKDEPEPEPEAPASGVRAAMPDVQEELEALRASEKHLSERVSELSHQLMAAKDLATAAPKGDAELREQLGAARQMVATLTEERDHSRAENIRLTVMVGSLEDRFEGARRGYELRIAELVHDLSMAAETPQEVAHPPSNGRVEGLEGEVAGLRARLEDREAALAALSKAAPSAAGSAAEAGGDVDVDAIRDEADRLRAQNADLKDRETDLTVRLADAEELSELEATRANDLASTVAARDALVNRLQLDLADEERRARELEENADRFKEEAERLREAVVDASEQMGSVDDLAARVSELEEALKNATTRAETHGGRMDAAEEVLREARANLGELATQLEEGGVSFGKTAMGIDAPDSGWNEPAKAGPGPNQEVARLEARLETMEREAADRETLLRSLTAQLEERDERLRSTEKGGPSDRDLRQNMVELQERAAKLSESLANERRARREAEAAASGKRSEEMEKLHDALGDRDAELLVLRGQVSSAERELKSFREAAAETRSGLEELLGAATAQGDPGTAERVGGLLRVLSRVT